MLRSAVMLLSLLLVVPGTAQRKMRDSDRETTIMRAVAVVLEQAHYSGKKLDDRVSERAFESYLKTLDPLKLFFLKRDVELLGQSKKKFDDMLRQGKSSYAISAFKLLLVRVGQRVDTALELLDGKFDFDREESYVAEPELRDYAMDDAQARELWRRRLKYSLLSMRYNGMSDDKAKERLRKRYRSLRERLGKQRRDETIGQFVNAVASSFDPHTVYLAPKPYEDFKLGVTLNYQGIGALLGEEEDGSIVIRRVIPGGAVERYGKIKSGDKIVGVGQGTAGDLVDITGMRVNDVVELIRGKKDTIVRLSIVPVAGGRKRLHTIRRAAIKLEERAAKARVVDQLDGEATKKIGVIDLPGFYRDVDRRGELKSSSTEDVRRMLVDFKSKGVEAVVLDLRRNTGGFLPEALGIAGLFLDRGPVVQVRSKRRGTRVLDDPRPGVVWDGPLVVLQSRVSASASEIVAGAVRDYGRGLIVGASSHGKGTVQTTVDLAAELTRNGRPGELGVLKLTIQMFYRPNGDSTQSRGIPVDVELPSWLNALDDGESDLPNALPFDRIAAAEFDRAPSFGERQVDGLRKRSTARRADSEHYQKLARQIPVFLAYRDRPRLPLQEAEFNKVRAAIDEQDGKAKAGASATDEKGAEGEKATEGKKATGDEKADDTLKEPDEDKIDPGLAETLRIVVDYIKATRK